MNELEKARVTTCTNSHLHRKATTKSLINEMKEKWWENGIKTKRSQCEWCNRISPTGPNNKNGCQPILHINAPNFQPSHNSIVSNLYTKLLYFGIIISNDEIISQIISFVSFFFFFFFFRFVWFIFGLVAGYHRTNAFPFKMRIAPSFLFFRFYYSPNFSILKCFFLSFCWFIRCDTFYSRFVDRWMRVSTENYEIFNFQISKRNNGADEDRIK